MWSGSVRKRNGDKEGRWEGTGREEINISIERRIYMDVYLDEFSSRQHSDSGIV
jgi:hypothetical protein